MNESASAERVAGSSARLVPPLYFLLFNAMLIALNKLLALGELIPMPWAWAGLVPIALGTLLAAAGGWQFHRRRTAIVPFRPSTTLVRDGVYRLSRNPMYLGMVLAMAGVATIAGSISVWIVPPLFAWVLWRRFIRFEEALLAMRFGADYAAYQRQVRRWV